ncbi:MAG: alkaline phosphatase family protein [Candidatus Omnitrophica bacterium]|nr:hypothetical protein [bacterium]NUN96841.1 alkaline phosphatase family protein [Candidatus Omnitrophota bacterium]
MMASGVLARLAALVALFGGQSQGVCEGLQMLVVLDGLRPDYVTAERMPHLHAWSLGGVVCERHHSVFPTVTRVNASAFATGCYPERHGILGNTVFFPEVDPASGLSTGSRKTLMRIEEATYGNLLTAPSLGEILDQAGKKLLVVSSGSSGSSFLLNHKGKGAGTIHYEYTLPEGLMADVQAAIGPPPEEGYPNEKLNHWAVDALLEVGLDRLHPDVLLVWLSDPDHTAHKGGMGYPLTNEALSKVDAEFGRILAGLRERGLFDKTNLFVASDHGFSTHTGRQDLSNVLIAAGLKTGRGSTDVVVSEGAIYVRDQERERIEKIARLLQGLSWIGPVFTQPAKPGGSEGWVPGTLSRELARWSHSRSGDILVSAHWTDEANEHGFRGTTAQQGVAGHGTASPYDIHNTLIAGGPALKQGIRSPVPSGNVDLAPTLLHLSGVTAPQSMQGRLLSELLKEGPDTASIKVNERTHAARTPDGTYRLRLVLSETQGRSYLDYTQVERSGRQ